ncbi:ubiquitin carboxyl-terminal hydrolase 37-like [Conger conger]|uniref:ubiquitin carboxyl-terminal hydrolase 37-like n=1 Tax=Conger conger TaxID=82655 RepID=UPI002A5A5556|nr:ubiquitin carboxyl-terminal hydrolase 37-like [Conger conger]
MAPAPPKVLQGDSVRIRICSLELGTTRWKEGSFEIHESDGKANLWVKFNCGGAPKIFQLKQNVKNVVLGPMQSLIRLAVTLKDSSVTFDRVPVTLAQKMKEYLERIKEGKHTVLKTTQRSASFGGILGKRLLNESSPRTGSVERRVKARAHRESPRKQLGSPGRMTSTPERRGLSENRSEKRKRLVVSDGDVYEDYPKENDSSSNNNGSLDSSQRFLLSCKEKLKQSEDSRSSGPVPLQTSSFYSGHLATKDYSQGRSFLDRPTSTIQSPSSRRSLSFPSHSTPFKRLRPSTDYSGWNRPRSSALAPLQAPLQGFSNLGNTCYMNAILQSLFSLQSFSNDLLKQGVPCRKIPANALLRRFILLLLKKDTSTPEMKRDLLRRVKSAISSTAERFSGYMQNDAHEFLSQCLDQLKDDVEKMNKSLKQDAWEGSRGVRPGEQPDASRIYTCPVVANMDFEVQHTITCKGCGGVVTKREQFNDLSIDLPRSAKTLPLRSLQDSLDLFFRMEEIEYSCEKCDGKSATVTHKFSKLPRVLILHLKRYSYNAQLCLNSKLGQQVFIPKYLSLSAHCTDSTRPPLCLGWTAQTSVKGSLKPDACISLDSDSEEEVTRKTASGRRRLGLGDERVEKVSGDGRTEPLDSSGISDDELLAAVLEMSRRDEVSRSQNEPSSPDTGFGDADVPDLLHNNETPADMLGENKENETPWGAEGETDWPQLEKEKEEEERELQMALAQSLQEHEAREMEEDDDLKKATELSLQEFSRSVVEFVCPADDSGNEEAFAMDYSEAEAEELKRNAETGEMANSFRLVSVVSHIGSSSSSGHYVSDVYDMKKQSWLTYNDLNVTRTQESAVQRDRDQSGYIYFYMQRELFEELERRGGSSDTGRAVLQPL